MYAPQPPLEDPTQEEEEDVTFDPDEYEMDDSTFGVEAEPEDPVLAARRVKEAISAGFFALLTDTSVMKTSRWDRVMPKIALDPRFKLVPTHNERRSLFEKFIRAAAEEVRKGKDSGTSEMGVHAPLTGNQPAEEGEMAGAGGSVARRGAVKNPAAEDERRRREDRVRRQKMDEAEDIARRRQYAALQDAHAHFRTLLTETVKDPEALWAETLPKLRRDAQSRADVDGPLPARDMQEAFEAHVAGLLLRAADDVRALLESSLRAHSAEDFLVWAGTGAGAGAGGGAGKSKKRARKKTRRARDDGTPEGSPAFDGGGSGVDTDDDDGDNSAGAADTDDDGDPAGDGDNPLTSFVAAAEVRGGDRSGDRSHTQRACFSDVIISTSAFLICGLPPLIIKRAH